MWQQMALARQTGRRDRRTRNGIPQTALRCGNRWRLQGRQAGGTEEQEMASHRLLFDVATDGACKADRPEGQKNKKWHPTDCSQLTTATAHPLKKPAAFKKCLAEMS